MAEILHIATASARPSRPRGFVETPTALDITRSLELVRDLEGMAITMISGAPGIGKTKAVEAFCADLGNAGYLMPIAPSEGSPANIARNIMEWFRCPCNGLSVDQMRHLVMQYLGRNRTLILDEAQNATPAALDWLRMMAEEGEFNLVFVGDLALSAKAERLPQLYRRLHRPVVVTASTREDVEAYLVGTAYEGSVPAIDALTAATKVRGGNLGNVDKVLTHARLFAGHGMPDLAHLRAALLDMKMQPRGTTL